VALVPLLGLAACGGGGGSDAADGSILDGPALDLPGTDLPRSDGPGPVDLPVDTPAPDADSGIPGDGPADGGADVSPDVDYQTFTESEPNDGNAKGEIDPIAVPAEVTGAIDPADDVDIFEVTLSPGTRFVWELAASGGELAPHFAMSQEANNVPTVAATGGAGAAARQEHFVLEGGTYFVFVRDSRNVPADSSAHVGGPGFTWQLTATPVPLDARQVTLPSQLTDSLPTPTSIRLYRFSGEAGTGFDIVLRAERRVPASDMDSRVSLYDVNNQAYLITNDDDVAEGTLDSHVGGELPATGDYIVVVENVAPAAGTLDYDLDFTLR
jgi:hypothetical protein